MTAAALWAAIDRQPLVRRDASLSASAIAQARRLLAGNDPRRMRPGEQRLVAVPAAMIDEAINYLASRAVNGRGAFTLEGDRAEVRLTLRAPVPADAMFINLRAGFDATDGEPRIARASVGSLPIPATLANAIVDRSIRAHGYEREWTLTRASIRHLAFEPEQQVVMVGYVWEPALLDGARNIAFAPEDIARLQAAHARFARLLDDSPAGMPLALSAVLKPMLATEGEDSAGQRRAALLVLATYLAERNIAALIPAARTWPRLKWRPIILNGRYDSAQHFVISATLAAWAGEPAADAIGLYKEFEDARLGSGFSFADLAADHAGTRFGQLVVKGSARLESLLQQDLADGDLSPPLAGLPEYLAENDYRQRFGDPDSAASREISADIDRRLATLPLYSGEP
jgi:hypothetical protein